MADHEYIVRRLMVMASEALVSIQKAVVQFEATAAGQGAYGGSRMHLHCHETAAAMLQESLADMATFAFNASEGRSEEAAQAVERAGLKVIRDLKAWLDKKYDRTTSGAAYLGPPLFQLEDRLHNIVKHAVDDFRHGMVGVLPLKKDPLVNIVSNIANSPGAVQQTALGQNNQQSIQQQKSELIEVIDDLVASDEFKSLSELNRFAVRDTADVLREEIAKPDPDQSKVRRWAERLLAFTREFGMHVAATALAKLVMG